MSPFHKSANTVRKLKQQSKQHRVTLENKDCIHVMSTLQWMSDVFIHLNHQRKI